MRTIKKKSEAGLLANLWESLELFLSIRASATVSVPKVSFLLRLGEPQSGVGVSLWGLSRHDPTYSLTSLIAAYSIIPAKTARTLAWQTAPTTH